MTLTLRLAAPFDLDAINARYASIDFLPSHPGELIVIAETDGSVCGQGRIVPIAPGVGELGGIHVLPGHQGQGIARHIVQALLAQSTAPVLYCLPFAELAGFYGALGFDPLPPGVTPPQAIQQKHLWCKATYDKPVLLLRRTITSQ